jgi:hypothetical protein
MERNPDDPPSIHVMIQRWPTPRNLGLTQIGLEAFGTVHVKLVAAVYREALHWIQSWPPLLHNDFIIPPSDNRSQGTVYLTFFALKRISLTP